MRVRKAVYMAFPFSSGTGSSSVAFWQHKETSVFSSAPSLSIKNLEEAHVEEFVK